MQQLPPDAVRVGAMTFFFLFALLLLVGLPVCAALLVGRGRSVGVKILAGTAVFWSVLVVGAFLMYFSVHSSRQINRAGFVEAVEQDARVSDRQIDRAVYDTFNQNSARDASQIAWSPSVRRSDTPQEAFRSDIAVRSIAAALLLVAGAIVVSVLAAGKQRELTVRGAVSSLLSLVWAVPVIAVLCYLGLKIAPALQDQETPLQIRYAKYDPIRVETRGSAHPQPVEAPPTPEEGVAAVEEEVSLSKQSHDPSAGDSLPDWVTNPAAPGNGTEWMVVCSRQWSTTAEAYDDLEQLAALKLKENFHRHYPYKGEWKLPSRFTDLGNRDVFRDQYVERVNIQAGTNSFPVVRVHAALNLSESLRDEIHLAWRAQIAERRLWSVGGLVGLATLVVASLAGYFRLDSATKGGYRRRLKLATVSLIVAGGLVAASVLPVS